MKRSCFLGILLLSIFLLVGCGNSDRKSTGLFLFSADDFKKAESFTKEHEDDLLVLRYPQNWREEMPVMGAKFIIMKEDYVHAPNTSMNIVQRKSDPRFADASIETIKKEFPKALLSKGITKVKFVQIQRDTWQDQLGMCMEYTGSYKGEEIHYMQYFRDNGKNITVITFTIDEREWQETENEVKSIAASIIFTD